MATGTPDGELAVKVLDEYIQDFQKRNPTLRVFSCYLHQDEATPHLHIDFVPYVTGWKGKGMDTRVSLKQALKSLGFQGGNKHDTELNQWINHEKEILAEIMEQHGIEWEQKGTHEKHLGVYEFKKQERIKDVFCKPFLHKIAKSFCRLLHLHFVGNCKTSAGSYSASHKPLQIIFSCYSTRYGNGSSESSSSCACSLK